jgi:antibiotic biosynthesis monooxygenase (ABM) superfamily enzyme
MRNPTFAVFVTAAIAVSAPAWAQRPTIRRAVVTNVKPGHADEFEAAVKQYNEVYAKLPGVRSRGMLQSLSGPRQYILVRDYEKWADLDPGPVSNALAANAELSRINQRIMSCIESSTTLVEELLPELSMASSPAEAPIVIRLARSRIRPDKTAEFEAIVKNELVPANRKAGTKSFTVRRVRFGGPTNDYYISSRMDGWAEIGSDGLAKSMGAEAYRGMVAKLTAITLSREVNLYRFREDLSYRAKAPGVTGTTAAAR